MKNRERRFLLGFKGESLKNTIIFSAGKPKVQLIRLAKGKFYWKGKEVKDTKKIYERFCEWMKKAEIQ